MALVNQDENPPLCLLSGASGMLGTALRLALAARGTPVVRLVRTPGRAGAPAEGEVVWSPGAESPLASASALAGCRAAVHLSGANVGAHRWTAAYKREIAESRVASTRALARALDGLKQPPECLIVASAVGFYGDRGDEVLDETSPAGTGFLAEVCRQWEEAARPAIDAGIRVVHLRLGVVLGPCGGALEQMLPAFRLGLGGPLGNGRQWMSWISLEDAVRAILFALEPPAPEAPALAGPVNLTAPQPVTNAGFTRLLAAHLHRPAVFRAPAFALRLAFGQMADETLLASARVLPARLTAAGFRFSHPSVDRALAYALGTAPVRSAALS
jgi:hypothetical protein